MNMYIGQNNRSRKYSVSLTFLNEFLPSYADYNVGANELV